MAERKAVYKPGERIGKYTVVKALDETGVSAVYVVEHPYIERRVGLKILFEEYARDEAEVARFFHDATLIANLKHPGLADVLDADFFEGRPFMAMEFVEGRSLEQIVESSERMDLGVFLGLMVGVAGTLQVAHDGGLIHRDLEPSNIIVSPTGVPVLVGMGRPGRPAPNPPAGHPGAPSYTSPELTAGERGDARSDIWSLGATMYHVFLHNPRIGEDSGSGGATRVAPLVDLSDIEGRAPSYVLRIVGKCIHEDPEKRYESVRELRRDLEAALEYQDPNATATMMQATISPQKTLLVRVEYHQPDLPGEFREYQIEALAGRGTFGDVYRAFDLQAEMRIALKILRSQWLSDPATVERFRREAKLLAGLSHENLVELHNVGRLGDSYFMALQYVSAPTLRRLMSERGPMEPRQALEIMGQVLSGLEALHQRGVVHRDLKPANLFVDGSRALIADLGIAYADFFEPLTMAGATPGSPAYMSPEQALGRSSGPRSDLYAAGVILYELLSGRRPHEAETVAQLLNRVAYEPAAPLGERRPGLPGPLLVFVRRLLAPDAAERPQSAAMARRELYEALSEIGQ